jgi:hypothetical protein
MTHLGFKLSAQTKGLQRAWENFRTQYGTEEGKRIFLKKADEQGVGNTTRQRANSIYKYGGKQKNKQKPK